MARVNDRANGDITGAIRPLAQSANGRVPTVPTPLPPDPVVGKGDLELLRNDLRDLRRIIGRIDASQDVLARRIANLEDGIGASQTGSLKPVPQPTQVLTPIVPLASGQSLSGQPATGQTSSSANSSSPSATPQTEKPPQVAAPALSLPVSANAASSVAQPTSAAVAPAAASASLTAGVGTTPGVPLPAQRPVALTSLRPPDPQAEKSAFDRNAVDRSTLERMLMQRAQSFDPDNTEANSVIPALPDPVSVVPKTRPMVLPPQPLASVPPLALPQQTKPADPKAADAKTDPAMTGSLSQKPVLPIDPTKAVPVPQLSGPAPAKASDMSPEDQRLANEKLALAMRQDQPPAKPTEQLGIDLGGFKSIAQVKKVWSDFEIRQTKLAKALTPLARLSESSEGVEIRLVAGPFTDKEQAIRTCRQLRGATAKCDPVAYAGEAILTKPTPEAERRPAPAEPVKEPAKQLPLPKLDLSQKPAVRPQP